MSDEQQDQLEQACFPIRTVCAETGVNAITLRAWERRYGLIKPLRTASGHRLYSQADIDLVRRIMVLQDKGVPVSRAIAWLRQHPEDGTDTPPPSLPPPPAGGESPTAWAALRDRMLDAAARFDDYDLATAWTDAVDEFPVDVVTNFLLLPVGYALRDRQAADPLGRAVLHFYWAFLRNRLGARFANQSRDAQGAKIVLAAAPGSAADVALLLVGIALAQQGLRPLLFAPGTPVPELGAVVRRCRARGLMLVADQLPPVSLCEELATIARDGIAVFAGGEALAPLLERLRASGVVHLDAEPGNAARLVRDILGDKPSHAL